MGKGASQAASAMLAATDAELGLGPEFNVVVPFIDRHLHEGRAAKIAIRTAKAEISYGELLANVNRCGNALLALGLARGERMLMIVKDCPEFFYLFWGAIKAGIVPVPLNTLLRTSDYQYMIEDSQCAAVFWSPEFASEVSPAIAAARPAPKLAMPVEGGDCLIARLGAASEKLTAVPSGPEAECFWLYSSGSTGRPKGAVHRHRDMVVTSQFYGVDTLGAREEDIFFSAAKLFFAYGLGNGMTFPLWVGGTSVLLEARPTPISTFDVIAKFRPTLYFGVPTLYAAQLQALDKQQPADFSSVRMCVSAGEALPADVFNRWKAKTGTLILDGLGSTEALHIFLSNRADDFKPGASGRVVKGYDARIVDESGQEVGPNTMGRLHVKGASNAAYYWNNPARTKSTMLGDWLDTGDTYYRDAEGTFYYCGRNDDMLKIGGIWCSPFEIESALALHPKVIEVAVVGRADESGLIKPEACIVLDKGCEPSPQLEEELVRHCKDKLAPYKFPRGFRFVEELPKTATGKVQRFKLKLSQAAIASK